jgi:hypothetical protein
VSGLRSTIRQHDEPLTRRSIYDLDQVTRMHFLGETRGMVSRRLLIAERAGHVVVQDVEAVFFAQHTTA